MVRKGVLDIPHALQGPHAQNLFPMKHLEKKRGGGKCSGSKQKGWGTCSESFCYETPGVWGSGFRVQEQFSLGGAVQFKFSFFQVPRGRESVRGRSTEEQGRARLRHKQFSSVYFMH